MANISKLPAHLKEHARKMPDGLLDKLHPAEAEHRLQAVADMVETANKIPNPAVHRHALSHADRLRDAAPYMEYTEQRDRLKGLASAAPNLEIGEAYSEALREHEYKNEQAPGVGEAIMVWEKANPQNVAKARKAARDALIKAELDKAYARLEAEQARLRQEIQEFKRERGIV